MSAPALTGDTARPALVVTGVQVNFGGRRALDVDELIVPSGQIVGIVGANGAGKTTLLDVISGFVIPTTGSVRVGGEVELVGASPVRRARHGIARSFQNAGLFPSLTVAQTVAAALHHRLGTGTALGAAIGSPWARRRERRIGAERDDLIERMGLDRFYDKMIGELSTGTRRIVDLTCVLAQAPTLLMLDEPGAGVAQSEIPALRKLILSVRGSLACTVLVIEHDIPLLRSICDSMFALEAGRVIAHGTPEAVLSDPEVVAAYLGTDRVAIDRSGAAAGPHPAPDEGDGP
jgi:ABC-type branched-subunit amino acid transport system ATPase component